MEPSQREHLLTLVREAGVFRSRDLAQHGIAREQLRRLHRQGALERVARGLYVLPDGEITEQRSLAEVSKRVDHGIVCLLSALRFHHLTTQSPSEVWLAIDPRARHPRVPDLPLRIVRFSGPALREGVEEHVIDGVPIRVYNPAKTVADCFKFRNKIGLDVALEALRDCWRQRRATMDDLWRFAQICRVAEVMRPYLESLV